ncbi:MAG: ribokinase [Chloroflexi bacterium]|jgi:pseudouridine kinase|nr:ribokinase [Chloroflexota bacterium]MBT3670908.1 ribokinase [Chloroflexota bacterium]MBT4306378.1 ribokinase [Chloroflexota bacterium]MBT4532741.1 ribokinase [Chloroflexota bacterium]MBT4756033.1 ribokinase [Chloroflexota bacterium]
MINDLSLQQDKPVLVLGSSSVDIVGLVENKLERGTSNPGKITTSFGGTARNFSENLARLGQEVTLLSTIGKDQMGRQLLKFTQKAGVNTEYMIQTKDYATGSYLAVVNQEGELQFGLDDIHSSELLTPEYLEEHVHLFEEAALLFLDANLREDTLEKAMQIAQDKGLLVATDPTSISLSHKLKPYLPNIFLMTPNHIEAANFCDFEVGEEVSDAEGLEIAKQMVSRGVEIAIVTLAEFGVCYATSESSGHIPAIRTQIVDPTGGGDALSATVIFALLNGIPVDEAVRLGVSAASLTLKHRGAVYPNLNLEILYDQLI